MVRKLLKWAAVLLVAVASYLIIAAKFGTYEERYECKGIRTFPDGSEKAQTIYIKITHYRWFLFWSGDGSLWAEIPYEFPSTYPRIRESDDNLFALDSKGDQAGHFSRLSNTLNLRLSGGSVFKGACVKILLQ